MHTKKVFLFLFCFARLFASSQTPLDEPEEESHFPAALFFSGRQDIGSGVGYKDGYTTVEESVFSNFSRSIFPFLDLRFHRLLNNTYACNAGVGFRIFFERICKVFGMNSYYDYRSIRHAHFNQVGLGFEWLSSRWNIHLNGYLPVGKKRGLICSKYETEDSFFLTRKNYELALSGLNLDFEALLMKRSGFFVYALGGPYYYYGSGCRDVIGGLLGISTKYKEIFFLKFSGTYDTVFNGRLQGTVGITLPLGGISTIKRLLKSCLFSENIFLDSIKRNEIIVLDKRCDWKWNY